MAEIILGSKSSARRMLLANARIPFEAVSSDIDEDSIKKTCVTGNVPLAETAMRLAVAKAMKVSADYPEAVVISADQILDLDKQGFDKPETMEEAATRLKEFSGTSHYLRTAACVVRNCQIIWQKSTAPKMTLRVLTKTEIGGYLDEAGEGVLSSVGAYQLEGPGIRLFDHIEGDYFSILGLPLLDLISFLRDENLVTY